MTVQEFACRWLQFLNIGVVYYVMQIVRCAILSYAVFAIVCLGRETLFRDNIFFKGALWSLFIPVLFVGRMKFFYENEVGRKLFSWWTEIGMGHTWICWLYLSGVAVYGFRLFLGRRKLEKLVDGMEKREMGDILRALLWINPLLAVDMKFLRQDMEEICEWITIQKSGKGIYKYGQLLIKSMKVLQEESAEFNMYAAFAGDREYRDIRQRVTKIAGYKPYKRMLMVNVAVITALCVLGAVFWIQNVSYSRCSEDGSMMVYGYDGESVVFFNDSDVLSQMISYDDSYVYVDREAFESFLRQNNAQGEIFIVFGGFYKLPGFGGGGRSCLYETVSGDKIVRIPYERLKDDWMVTLFKIL